MKKLTVYIMATAMLLAVSPVQLRAEKTVAPIAIHGTTTNELKTEAEIKTLLLRLDEINAMDKSNLSNIEKKNLRTEVRSIKSELAQRGGGLYISVGAVIVIILLLILLF